MSRPNKILVAYNGTPHSKQALEWAIDLSRNSNGSVVVVNVFDPVHLMKIYDSEGGNVKMMRDAIKETEESEREMLEEAKAYCASRGVHVKTEHLHGNTAQTIVKYAKDEQIDLIIAGTKGHGELEEMLLGSVTRNLVLLAHVPVLVVKN
jgi:nucleotide-binding universal stress UspA family protein